MTEDRNAQPASGFGKLMHGVTQFGVIVAMVLLLKTVAAEAYFVPSGSMLPSLLVGDYLLVSKFPYGYSRYSLPVPLAPASSERLLGKLPERGDVVVFRLPRDPSQTYVKRVIGLPGDRVQMRAGRLCGERQDAAAAPRRHRRDRSRRRHARTGAALRRDAAERARASDLQISPEWRARRHAAILS